MARSLAGSSIQATDRSFAGSPEVRSPKSITALIWPALTRMLAGCRSPWTQAGGPAQGLRFRGGFPDSTGGHVVDGHHMTIRGSQTTRGPAGQGITYARPLRMYTGVPG